MNSDDLLEKLNTTELIYEATALVLWDIDPNQTVDSIAKYMYKGGVWPPQNSIELPRHIKPSQDDNRPDKKYWVLVKEELTAFLCTNDKRYKELWSRIEKLEKTSTSAVVLVVSAYLGERFGVQAAVLAGFVAVIFYGAIKIGKEAYCRYSLPNAA